ncbi:MAG: hypothetical protein JO037_26680 [Actinobacteria bacterium]|nr:hypothetical protein [Actinomycetota bacterium]
MLQRDPYLPSLQAAIQAGVPFVMVTPGTYTRISLDHPAVFPPRIMRALLRQRMRFRGVIVSDDGAPHRAARCPI